MGAARAELREVDPQAWLAFLLCLGAGLRKGEADNLQWAHVDQGRRTIQVVGGKTWDSAAEVPIADDTAAELERLRPAATDVYVLEGGPRPDASVKRRVYGAEPTWKRLTEWLRKHGVNSASPIHTLRKEAGSLVNAAAGIHAASRFLRHADLAVTSAHYADARTRVVVPLFEAEKS